AQVCEIYTDVEGVFTTDPRLVKDAGKIARIAYDDLLELASLGAGVMHSRSIEFAKKYRVPVLVRPAYSPGEGTLIGPEGDAESVVTGAALAKNEARVTLRDIPDRPGVLSQVFTQMAQRKIPIDMVVQDIGADGRASVSFTVPQDELAETLTAAEEAVRQLGSGHVDVGSNLSKVSAVGSGMQTHTGVAAQMFAALSQAGVNIDMITTSDIKISALVDRDQAVLALQAVHQAFDLHRPQQRMYPTVGVVHEVADDESDQARQERERDVVSQLASMEDIVVSEVDLDRSQALITLRNLPDQPGVAAEIFGLNAEEGVMVDLIVKNVSHEGRSNISFTVPKSAAQASLEVARRLVSAHPGAVLNSTSEIAKLSVLGIGLRTHTGVGQRLFQALADAGVNVKIVSTSEVCISTIVDQAQAEQARLAVQRAFGRS
ncbi:MAG: aspartate kinase, partial [Planctomycetaceae bacterium]